MNNESSEVTDILLPVTFILTLRPGLIMSKTADDSLLACEGHRIHYPKLMTSHEMINNAQIL